MAFNQILSFVILITIGICSAVPVGFSYAKFSGPVSGPEKEVFVHDAQTGHGHVDYIAKPDYHFSYGVEDPKTKVLQNRKESRNGDSVRGEYSVVDPDGTLRVVKYTADKVNGFQAEVITNGKSSQHGHEAPVHQVNHDYQQPPANHESYGTHEDARDEDDEEEGDDEDDDDDSY